MTRLNSKHAFLHTAECGECCRTLQEYVPNSSFYSHLNGEFSNTRFFLIRTNFIRTARLKLLKLREQIKNILRLGSSKIKIQDNNNLYFLKKLIPE